MIPEGLTEKLDRWTHPLTVAEEREDGVARFVWGDLDDGDRAVLLMTFRDDRWVFHSLRSSWQGEKLTAFLCRVLGSYAVEAGVEWFAVVSGGRATGLWEAIGFEWREEGYVCSPTDIAAYGERQA